MTSAWTSPDPSTYLERWDLAPDGDAFSTPSSHLVPVRQGETPAMLKVSRLEEERRGGRLMVWWDGRGAARVLAHDDDAVLLERATGPRSLYDMSTVDLGSTSWVREDAQATRALCDVAHLLHGVQALEPTPPPDGLVPLTEWFSALLAREGTQRGFLNRSAVLARELLADERDVVVLHGDLHHGNVLDFGTVQAPVWRAVDPKSVVGERAFDFAPILCNPSAGAATAPGRLTRQVQVISDHAGVDRDRLLRWVVAYAALSVVWYDESPATPGSDEARATTLQVGRTAEDLLRV